MKESIVYEGFVCVDILIMDLFVRLGTTTDHEAMFYIKEIFTIAWSYCTYNPCDVLCSAEGEEAPKISAGMSGLTSHIHFTADFL